MRSDTIKKGFERAPHKSLLKATGLKDEDFNKPFVGVCNSYIDLIPGHVHLQEYGRRVKEWLAASSRKQFGLGARCPAIAAMARTTSGGETFKDGIGILCHAGRYWTERIYL